jgi:integrase
MQHAKDAASGASPMPVTWTDLVEMEMATFHWEGLSPVTRAYNRNTYARICRDLDGRPELAPAVVTEAALIRWLRTSGIALNSVRHFRTCLRTLLAIAVQEGLRTDALKLSMKLPKFEKAYVRLWTQADVDALSAHAIARGFPEIGLMIRVNWEIGQRLGDLRFMRYGVDYQTDGCFWFRTHKTNVPVLIQAPPHLRALLDARYAPGELLFADAKGEPWDAPYLSIQFRRLKEELPQYAGEIIKLSHLRHSVVVELARAGCTIAEIASITRHTMPTVYQVLHHYLPHDFVLAQQALTKRDALRGGPAERERDLIVEGRACSYVGDRTMPRKPLRPLAITQTPSRAAR